MHDDCEVGGWSRHGERYLECTRPATTTSSVKRSGEMKEVSVCALHARLIADGVLY